MQEYLCGPPKMAHNTSEPTMEHKGAQRSTMELNGRQWNTMGQNGP